MKSQLPGADRPRADSSLTLAPGNPKRSQAALTPTTHTGAPPHALSSGLSFWKAQRHLLCHSGRAISRPERVGWGSVLGQEGVRPREGTGRGKGPRTELSC